MTPHRFATRSIAAAAIIGLAIVAAVAAQAGWWSPAAEPVGARAPDPQRPLEPAQYPCNPKLISDVDSRVVSADRGTIGLHANVTYECSMQAPPTYFLLVVESTNMTQPSGRVGDRLIANLKEGMTNFVQNMDYEHGSQGGMLLYNANVLVNHELEGGASGQRSLVNAIDRFTPTSNPSARAAGEAINRGTGLLQAAQAPSDTQKLMVVVDAGAPFTGADVDVFDACLAARNAGMTVAVFALDGASDRLAGCGDYFRASSRENGDDIPDTLGNLANSIAGADFLERLHFSDSIADVFEYVPGSGSPKEPDKFLNEIGWDLEPPAPPGGHDLGYRIRVREGTQPGVVRTSRELVLGLYYKSGNFFELRPVSQQVCIYPPDDPTFCDEFVATLTPRAPTATATATLPPSSTPTEEPVTATPTAEPPTPTAVPQENWFAYLPVAGNAADLGGA